MGDRGRTARAVLMIGFAAVVILMWLPRALAGHWIADDYCFASASIHDGFWRSQQDVYLGAAGRYSVAFLYAVLTRLGMWIAPALAIAAMLAWLFASWRAAHHAFRIIGADVSRVEEIAAGAGFVAAVMHAAPDTYQPLIWTGGLLTYGLPVIGTTFAVSLLLSERPRRAATYGLFALALVLGGCSEVAAVAHIVFSFIAAMWRRARRGAIAFGLGSVLALVLVAVAPGNFQRRTRFQPLPAGEAMRVATMNAPRAFAGILLDGYTLFLPLALLVAMAGASKRPIHRRNAVVVVAASFIVVTATLFGGLVGTGRLPWARVHFVPVAWVTVAVVFIGFAMRSVRLEQRTLSVVLTIVIAMAGIAGLAAHAEMRLQMIADSNAFAASAGNLERVARAQTGRDVVVRAPRTFEYLEYLAPDADHWTNRCIARYFDLRSIRSTALPSRR